MTIDCLLTKGAWTVLRRECRYDGVGVDVTGSPWYIMVRLMLRREEVMRGGYARLQITDGEPGKLYVRQEDVRRLGHYISIENQANLNYVILLRERERICEEVRAAKVFGGIARDAAIDYYLTKHDLDEEIKYGTMRKWYQRRYVHTEESYYDDIQHLKCSKAGQKRDKKSW
jgi:hypothetical protein